jgi:hypothetical protein
MISKEKIDFKSSEPGHIETSSRILDLKSEISSVVIPEL